MGFSGFILSVFSGSISYILFEGIFLGLNRSMLMLFVPIQSFLSKIKKKALVKIVLESLCLGFAVFISIHYNFNYIIFGIIIGFYQSLINILFNKGAFKYSE